MKPSAEMLRVKEMWVHLMAQSGERISDAKRHDSPREPRTGAKSFHRFPSCQWPQALRYCFVSAVSIREPVRKVFDEIRIAMSEPLRSIS